MIEVCQAGFAASDGDEAARSPIRSRTTETVTTSTSAARTPRTGRASAPSRGTGCHTGSARSLASADQRVDAFICSRYVLQLSQSAYDDRPFRPALDRCIPYAAMVPEGARSRHASKRS